MHASLLFPAEYLGAADLHGRDVTLTISQLRQEELRVEGGTENKWIIHFAEMAKRKGTDQKKLVLNKTNAKTIQKMHGSETDEWIGKRITLYATQCKAFGEIVDCIRIRPGQDAKRQRAEAIRQDYAAQHRAG